MTDARKRAHEDITLAHSEVCLCSALAVGSDCAEVRRILTTALDAACEEARWDSLATRDWRKQMEAYGFDNVAKVLDMVKAAEERGRREALQAVLGRLVAFGSVNNQRMWLENEIALLKEAAQEKP